MATHSFKTYHAKILLFGEHLINLGSDALSIPYPKFNGKLNTTKNQASRLQPFLDFLRSSSFDFLDNEKLSHQQVLEFSSNIPEGYGCGSSGAIVAACYDHFKSNDIDDPKILKDRFSRMEAFFHGKSSGTDPLISYFNHAIKFSADSSIELIPDLQIAFNDHSLILVDSGQPREGKEYINWFMERSTDENFKTILTNELLPATQNCIAAFLNSEESDFKNSFAKISNIQLKYMAKMIPDHMQTLWIKGLESDKLHLKICGAGGGGFFIGLIRKDAKIAALEEYKIYSLV